MNDAGNIARRIVDGIEDTVEHVLKGGEDEHEHRHRHHEHHGEAGHGWHAPTGPVNVNVHVDCRCCPPRGQPGPTLPPGTRPPHATGTSDGTIPGGIADPGGIIGTVSRPPTVWPGPRDKLVPAVPVHARERGRHSARARSSGRSGRARTSSSSPASTPRSARDPDGARRRSRRPAPTTPLYAHVWNLGLAPAPTVAGRVLLVQPVPRLRPGRRQPDRRRPWTDLGDARRGDCHSGASMPGDLERAIRQRRPRVPGGAGQPSRPRPAVRDRRGTHRRTGTSDSATST